MSRGVFACLLAALGFGAAADTTCTEQSFEAVRYAVCDVDATSAELRLFLRDAEGEILGQFPHVLAQLDQEGKTLTFAMNAGMYHADRAPVGLYVEDGSQEQRLITSEGPGNFGLLPNGVFCIRTGRADVIESLRFEAAAPACRFATQSGPMLVIDGALHPRFLKDGTSKYIRNGVGTSADGARAVFVISSQAVNFHSFGRFFRDHLKLPNALYFDGNVSRLFAPSLGRRDTGFLLGPIVGAVVPQD